MTHDTPHTGRMPDDEPRRVGVVIRAGALYLSAEDVAAMLRARARAYRDRAEALTAQATDPRTRVEPLDRDVVTVIDEALACRMVAEELEQRADVLDAIG